MRPQEPRTANSHAGTNLRTALHYAKRFGWPVFPVNGKIPITPHGFRNASTDEKQIRQWWTERPDAGIAIVTGRASGLLVLDCDPRHHGEESLKALFTADHRMPRTAVADTGGGGLHIYFGLPAGTTVRSSVGRRGSGLDVRAEGGYVVAPPAVHASGKPYAWEQTFSPDDLDVAPAPDWLLERLTKPLAEERTQNGARATALSEEIHEGERNRTLCSLAGSMRRRGASKAVILAALNAENRSRCRPPLDDDEVSKIAASVARYTPEEEPQEDGDSRRQTFVPRIVPLSEVEPESVSFLWPGRIPFGKLTVLDGDPGLGKSTIALDLAARLTTGRPMPDGSSGELESATAIVLSAEDGLSDTIRPRLDAAGADTSRVFALPLVIRADGAEALPNLADHLPAIEAAVRQKEARLLIIDPLMAYLGREANSHRDQDVRAVLAPLAALAERAGTAVLLIRHLRKGPRADGALYAGGGSIGIAGAARSVLLAAKDPDNEDRRILAAVKSNLCKNPPSLAYRIDEDKEGRPWITWSTEPVEITADRLLAAAAEGEEERTARTEARDFLGFFLADGSHDASEVLREAKRRGIAEKTLRRAAKDLNIVIEKGGYRKGWSWSLPGEDGQTPSKMPTS